MTAAADSGLNNNQPLSEMERVVNTFAAPSKTFTDIKRSANWLVPWVLMSIVGLGLVFTVDKKLGMDTAYENQLKLSPKQMDRIDAMPADQKAGALKTGATITGYFAYGSPLMSLVFMGVIAGVLMATFNFGLGAEVKFMQAMAISMYAFLPSVLKTLIAIVVVAAGAADGFTFQNPVASNLGGLIDPNSSHFLYSILSSIDIFNIWILFLTGIGYSCITRVKRGTCMTVVFGWWALMALIGAGFAALFA